MQLIPSLVVAGLLKELSSIVVAYSTIFYVIPLSISLSVIGIIIKNGTVAAIDIFHCAS